MATKKAPKKSSTKQSPAAAKKAAQKKASTRKGRALKVPDVRAEDGSNYVVLFACDTGDGDIKKAKDLLDQFGAQLKLYGVIALAQKPG